MHDLHTMQFSMCDVYAARTHAERDGGHDDLRAVVRPVGLHLFALALSQRGVVVAARRG
jgi:hypothetical protein